MILLSLFFPYAVGAALLDVLINRPKKPTHPSLRKKTVIRPITPEQIALGKKAYLGPRNKRSQKR